MPNITKTITGEIINQADQEATTAVITRVIDGDQTLICNLYNGDSVVASRRVYSYAGGRKNIPFADMTDAEIDYMTGETPTDEWTVALIKAWLDDQQRPDEDGNVSESDPYYYTAGMVKAELLAVVEGV